ncbi:unnamed protein product, partial [Effrenium voratum]
MAMAMGRSSDAYVERARCGAVRAQWGTRRRGYALPRCEGVAVLVRVHGGTSQAMLRRHLAWAEEAREAERRLQAPVSVWLLADETFAGQSIQDRLRGIAGEVGAGLAGGAPQVFSYREAEMVQRFPALEAIRAALPDRPEVRDCFRLPGLKSLAWCFHVESLLLWWAREGAPKPKYLWVLEDDVGYSGHLGHFLSAYQHEPADLVSHALQPAEPTWVWYTAASKAFDDLVQRPRLRCAEHVQRLSSRLMEALQNFARSGVSGWSEMSVPTLCQLAGLSYCPLKPEQVGQIFTFNGKVPEEAWPSICQNERTRNRWWH